MILEWSINELRKLKILNDHRNRIQKFINYNKLLWRLVRNNTTSKNSNKTIIFEASDQFSIFFIRMSIALSILTSTTRSKALIISEQKIAPSDLRLKIINSWCQCEAVSIDELLKDNLHDLNATATSIFNTLNSPEDILKITYDGILLGECIYDGVIKYTYPTIFRLDSRVFDKILEAIKSYEATLLLLRKYEIAAGLFAHRTTSFQGPIVRALLKNLIPVYTNGGGLKSFIRYNRLEDKNARIRDFTYFPPAKYDQVVQKYGIDYLYNKGSQYLNNRMSGTYTASDWQPSLAYSSDKVTFTSKEEFCTAYNLDKQKPCVFVLLHAMVDDPHIYDLKYYRDFFHWFTTTLKIVEKISSVNWIFKQHPASVLYPRDVALDEIFFINDHDHITYITVKDKFNTKSLIYVADALVTGGGTAALEYACYGIPAIVAFKNHYDEYDICVSPNSLQEYKEALVSIKSIKSVPDENKIKATILFYLIYGKLYTGLLDGILNLNSDKENRISDPIVCSSIVYNAIRRHPVKKLINLIKPIQDFILSAPSENQDVEIYVDIQD